MGGSGQVQKEEKIRLYVAAAAAAAAVVFIFFFCLVVPHTAHVKT
jgi:hypothetical protein